MPALPTDIFAAVLEALRTHRNARRAAKLTGVNPATAWRIAKKHGIALISRAEHMKARRVDPAFIAKQVPAVREAASRWLKAQHAKPKFRKKSIEAARRNLTRLNDDPAFRQASSERLKRLHEDPAFGTKLEAARRAARRRKTAQLRENTIEAALRTLTRLDDDPAFRQAASERLNRLLHGDPSLHAKEAVASRTTRDRGFAIAPILYLLGLIGVGAGVLFSGYSQILRSNQTLSNTLMAKNDLQGTATTLAASSWLSTDQTLLCPPLIGSNSPSTPSTKCSSATSAITVGMSFANAVASNLPNGYASVSATGSPVEVGVFAAGSGAKVLDPWGHHYAYCRWENSIGTSNAIMVITAGANGRLETKCGDTTAQGDDMFVGWTTAVTQNRAAVWQTVTSGTAVTGTQFGATGTQINIDTSGNVSVPGTLGVTGATTLGTAGLSVTGSTSLAGLTASSGTFSGAVSATNGSFSGTLSASGTTTLGALSAGTSVLSSATITNNATVGGTLGVTGATTLGTSTLSSLSVTGTTFLGGNVTTSTALIQIGTSVVASGSSSPLFTIGKGVGSPAVYPLSIDQSGSITGSSFNGNVNGGAVSASSLTASGATTLSGTLGVTGATTLGSTLGVTGATTLSAALNGTSAVFSGNVQAASFTGAMSIGGGGVTLSGIVPISNGGTGQTSAGNALSGLFSGAGTIAQMIPGADLVNNSVTSTQLSTTGVTAGTYSSVTVGADGRVTSGGSGMTLSDGLGNSLGVGAGGVTVVLGSSTVGNWTTTGLMVGSSKAALDKLDVYGGVAIGTSYAGTTAAPTNGLIAQGQVAIGTSSANGALNVNGTVTATNFSGSGAGLTGIGTSSITGVVAIANGGTNASSQTANGVAYYNSTSITSGTGFVYTGGNVGIGTATPQTSLAVNGTTSFLFASDYTTTGNQADVALNGASAIRYNGAGVATFYGIAAGTNGQIIYLHNASSSTLTLSNQSGSEATAVNKIITGSGADLAMASNSSVILQYDTTAARWRVIGGSGGGGTLAGLSDVSIGTSLATNNILQYNGSRWANTTLGAALSNSNSTTTMITNWPDAIECTTTGDAIFLYPDHLPYSGNGLYLYRMIANTAGDIYIWYNSNGTYNSQSGASGFDCITSTLSITQLYAAGHAFNFIGSSMVSAAAPGGGVQFNNGSGVLAADSALTWDNTNKRLGIGTASPGSKLVVSANTAALSTALSPLAQFAGADGTSAPVEISAYAGNPKLIFRRGNTTAAAPSAVQSADNLGVVNWAGYGATGYSSARAQIAGVAAENWTDTAQGTAIVFTTTTTGGTSTAERMRIDNNGNVGIGTTGPADQLTVYNSSFGGGPHGMVTIVGGSESTVMFEGTSIGVDQDKIGLDATNNQMIFRHAAATRMVIDSSGNVGIGTTNPSNKLHISAGDSSLALFGPNATWNGSLYVGAAGSQVASGKAQVIASNGNLHLDAGTGQSIYLGYFTADDSYINPNGGVVYVGSPATILTGGSVLPGTLTGGMTGPTLCRRSNNNEIGLCNSSERYKKNIADLHYDALSILDRLRPVEFDWITDSKAHDIGFIAEQVAPVVPELVIRDEKGRPDALHYDHLSALLVKAMQQLKADNDNLAAEHTADANAIDELRHEVAELKRNTRAR